MKITLIARGPARRLSGTSAGKPAPRRDDVQDSVTGLNGLPGMNAQILDVHQILDDAVAAPAAFGFVNVTEACITPGEAPFTCKRPDTYAFWDGIHPTRALHAIVAEQALAIVSAPEAKGSR